MARSYSAREGGTPLGVQRYYLQSLIEKRMSNYSGREGFEADASRGLGITSALQKELEKVEALMRDPNAKFTNERESSTSEFALDAMESKIKNGETEVAVVWDRDGRFISRSEGKQVEEAAVEALASQVVGGFITHNHPVGSSALSAGDIVALLTSGAQSIRAVSKEDGSTSEIRYGRTIPENENDPNHYLKGENGEALSKFLKDLPETWANFSQDGYSSAFFNLKGLNPQLFEKMGLKDGLLRLEPQKHKEFFDYAHKQIEKDWMKFVAGELEQYGFEYYHDDERV